MIIYNIVDIEDLVCSIFLNVDSCLYVMSFLWSNAVFLLGQNDNTFSRGFRFHTYLCHVHVQILKIYICIWDRHWYGYALGTGIIIHLLQYSRSTVEFSGSVIVTDT